MNILQNQYLTHIEVFGGNTDKFGNEHNTAAISGHDKRTHVFYVVIM